MAHCLHIVSGIHSIIYDNHIYSNGRTFLKQYLQPTVLAWNTGLEGVVTFETHLHYKQQDKSELLHIHSQAGSLYSVSTPTLYSYCTCDVYYTKWQIKKPSLALVLNSVPLRMKLQPQCAAVASVTTNQSLLTTIT
jgi:hypothetical protein